MSLLTRFRTWRAIRRQEKHIRWLRRMRVILPRVEPVQDHRNWSDSYMRSLK